MYSAELMLKTCGFGIFLSYFCEQLTWADLIFVTTLEPFISGHGLMPTYQNPEALKNHPALAEYKNRIENIPNIKDWIEKRPAALF